MNEPTLIAEIYASFNVEGRGGVGAVNSLPNDVRVGDEVELRLPDGLRRKVRITAAALFHGDVPSQSCGIMFDQISDKSQIPDGTEIWSLA